MPVYPPGPIRSHTMGPMQRVCRLGCGLVHDPGFKIPSPKECRQEMAGVFILPSGNVGSLHYATDNSAFALSVDTHRMLLRR